MVPAELRLAYARPEMFWELKAGVTVVAAALERAKNPICGFVGMNVDARPTFVHVLPSVL